MKIPSVRKINLFMVLLVSTISNQVYGQQMVFSATPDSENALEISSIVYANDEILLVTEKCKKLYHLDSSGSVVKSVSIDTGDIRDKNVEIEGATWIWNGLLLTNEKVGEVLYLEQNTGKVHKVAVDHRMDGDIGNQGIEGIAVDSIRGLCYILKEKTDTSESMIRVFNLRGNKHIPKLEFIKNVRISHPDNSWRFSDLLFNYVDNHLYLLKTRKGAYEIVKIDTAMTSQANERIPIEPSLHQDLSETINAYGKMQFNTNLEGIAFKEGNFYLVSDNATSSAANCSGKGTGKTLLLKIPF